MDIYEYLESLRENSQTDYTRAMEGFIYRLNKGDESKVERYLEYLVRLKTELSVIDDLKLTYCRLLNSGDIDCNF